MNDDLVLIQPTYIPARMPVFACDLTPIAAQLALARQAIDELRLSHPQSPSSNVRATYMSPWKSHDLNPKLLPICDSAVTIAREVTRSYLSADIAACNIDFLVTDCWGIIYEQEDYTAPHNHFPADFGCAIYLEADEDCAPIVFEQDFRFQPRAGAMVMFPGILTHEVPRNTSRRVVLAMNLFKRAVAPGV